MSDLYLFRNTLRDMLRTRRLLVAIVLVMGPAALAMMIRYAGGRAEPLGIYNTFAPLFVFGFILVILAVVFSTGVVSEEVQQKTIVYLLTRPTPRWRILLAKFAAALVVLTCTVWLSDLLLGLVLLGPGRISRPPFSQDLLMIPLGALVYGSVFLLLATLLNRPLIWGLLYLFGIESWASTLPGIQKISLMAYLRVLAPHTEMERKSRHLTEVMQAFTPPTISQTTAWTVLISVTIVALGSALYVFSRNEYVPREDAE